MPIPRRCYSVFSDNTYTTLVGTVNLNVQSPVDPALHNRDTIATISNLSPQTSNILYVQFVGSNGGPGYLNDMRITATTPAINGDYNANGKVDAADYAVWRKYAGTTHVLPNDPTGGTIGPAQYTTWRSNFGTGGPGAGSGLGSGSAVPEPATFVLACCRCDRLDFRQAAISVCRAMEAVEFDQSGTIGSGEMSSPHRMAGTDGAPLRWSNCWS